MKFLLGILIVSSFFLSSCDIIEEIIGGEDETTAVVEETETAGETYQPVYETQKATPEEVKKAIEEGSE